MDSDKVNKLQTTLSGTSEPGMSDSEISEMDSHLGDAGQRDVTWDPKVKANNDSPIESVGEETSDDSICNVTKKSWNKKDFAEPTWAKKFNKKLSTLTDKFENMCTKLSTLEGYCTAAKNFRQEIDDNFMNVIENLEEKFSSQIKTEFSDSKSILEQRFMSNKKFDKELESLNKKFATSSELEELGKKLKKSPVNGKITPTLLPWEYKVHGMDVVKPNILTNLDTLKMPLTKLGLINIFEFDKIGTDIQVHRWIRYLMTADTAQKQEQELCCSRLFWLLNNIITHLGHVEFFDKQKFKFTFKMIAKLGVTMKADHANIFLKARTLYGSFGEYKTLGDISPAIENFLPSFFRKQAHRFFDKAKNKTWQKVTLDSIRELNLKHPTFRAAPTPSAGVSNGDSSPDSSIDPCSSSDEEDLTEYFNKKEKSPGKGLFKKPSDPKPTKSDVAKHKLSDSSSDEPAAKKPFLGFTGQAKRVRDTRKEVEARIKELKATEQPLPETPAKNIDLDKLSKVMKALQNSIKSRDTK